MLVELDKAMGNTEILTSFPHYVGAWRRSAKEGFFSKDSEAYNDNKDLAKTLQAVLSRINTYTKKYFPWWNCTHERVSRAVKK